MLVWGLLLCSLFAWCFGCFDCAVFVDLLEFVVVVYLLLFEFVIVVCVCLLVVCGLLRFVCLFLICCA